MLTVLLDAGNTRIKVAYVQTTADPAAPENTMPGAAAEPVLVLTQETLPRLGDWLSQLPEAPSRVLGVSVASDSVRQQLEAAFAPSGPVRWLVPEARLLRLKNRYRNPAALGPDRWLGMLGVVSRRPADGPLMLVSFGTATTVDMVDAHETFLGGLIFPGVTLMQTSLGLGTARLPTVAIEPKVWPPFPQTTETAIGAGIVAAQVGAVLRQWQHAVQALGQAPLIFVTGGARQAVLPELQAGVDSLGIDMGFGTMPLIECESPVLDGLLAVALNPTDV